MICSNCNTTIEEKADVCPNCNATMRPKKTLLQMLCKTDEFLAGVFLSAMIIIVLVQIFLRNVKQTGIGGADSLVRHLVLWVVFLGAGIAAKDNSHIKIDFLPRFLPPGAKKAVEILVNLFSVSICCVLVYAACSFVSIEHESGIRLSLFNIPVWIMEVIIPAGYIIIAGCFVKNGIRAAFTKPGDE